MDPLAEARRRLLRELSPHVRVALDHREPRMRLKPRIIFDYELLYMEKGEMSLRIEQAIHTIVPGDIVLFKPGKEHEILKSAGECRMPHIHFDLVYDEDSEAMPINFKPLKECSAEEVRLIRPDLLGSVLHMPDIVRIGNHGEILHQLLKLIHAYDRRDEAFIVLQKSLVLSFLHQLIKGLEAVQNARLTLHERALEQTVTHIVEHYNRDVGLDELSRIACLSVYHFSRLFKEKYGLSPHQFQIRRRIEKAKDYMLYSRRSLTSIAEEIGYGSVYAFSKAFKQAEGVSPRQFVRAFAGN